MRTITNCQALGPRVCPTQKRHSDRDSYSNFHSNLVLSHYRAVWHWMIEEFGFPDLEFGIKWQFGIWELQNTGM